MPGSSNAVDFEGNEIIFEEDAHRYYSPETEKHPLVEYVSGTSLIHRYANSFEKKKAEIAERVARKRNITASEVIEEWNRNRDNSCEFGTRIHETCEDILLDRELRNYPITEKETKTFGKAIEAALKIKRAFEIVAVEKIIFDIGLGIAGTADLIVKSKRTGDIILMDWKTNQSIDFDNPYGDKMDGIFSYMDDCNFNVYSLQLSLYEYIMRKRRFVEDVSKPIQKYILHVTEDGSKSIKCADLGVEVRDMLIDWLSEKSRRVSC